jgi:hypothetical protein
MPPGIDYEFVYKNQGFDLRYSMDSIITFFMLARCYLVFKMITKYSKWRDKKSQRICGR